MKKILLLVFKQEGLLKEAERLRYVCKKEVSPKKTLLPSIIDRYRPNLIAIDDTCPRDWFEDIKYLIPDQLAKNIIVCKIGKNSEEVFPNIESRTFLRETEDILDKQT